MYSLLPDKAMLQERTKDPITLQEGKEVYIEQFILSRIVPREEEEENSGAGFCHKDCFCNDCFMQISQKSFVR